MTHEITDPRLPLPPIVTPRLILRPWSEGDAADLFEYAKDSDVGPLSGWAPHKNIEESKIIIREIFVKKGETLCISLKDEGKVIGSLGLHADRFRSGINCKMLGYSLSKDYWGRGIGTEAARAVISHGFEDMALDLISVAHFSYNLRSKRVIEKCGFEYEGTLRTSARLFDGSIVDEVLYSLKRDEYFKIKDSWK